MNENKKIPNFRVEVADIIFRNFSGKPTQFNAEGNRNFAVVLSDEDAKRLKKDGWNVKYLKPKNDDPTEYCQPYLPVKVKFGEIPPIIYIILPNNGNPKKIRITEDTVDQLDWANIDFCDMIIRPYQYPPSNLVPEGGISAYLKTLYVTIRQDDLDIKYGGIPESEDYMEE